MVKFRGGYSRNNDVKACRCWMLLLLTVIAGVHINTAVAGKIVSPPPRPPVTPPPSSSGESDIYYVLFVLGITIWILTAVRSSGRVMIIHTIWILTAVRSSGRVMITHTIWILIAVRSSGRDMRSMMTAGVTAGGGWAILILFPLLLYLINDPYFPPYFCHR